jgi:hypothetical protein
MTERPKHGTVRSGCAMTAGDMTGYSLAGAVRDKSNRRG